MTVPTIIATGVAVLVVVGAVAFRLLFGASQVAAAGALGRVRLPKSWQRFLYGERKERSN